ncbi:MAG: hypothetical protein QXM43_03725 [Desulfurococcaceae archaeon]
MKHATWRSLNILLKNKVKTPVKNHLYLLIANVVAVYLVIAGWNYYDVRYFISWYDDFFAKNKILEVYTSSSKVAYPPLAVLIFTAIHLLATKISSDIIIWRLIDKIPLLISFNLVYFLLRKNYGKFASYLWLLNFVAYAFIYAYQFDLIMSLFILLAMISIDKNNYSSYALWLTLAALIKYPVAVLLFIPIIDLLRNRNYKELVKYMLVITSVVSIIVLPFFIVNPQAFIEKVLLFHAKRPPQQMSIWAIPVYFVRYDLSMLPGFINTAWIIPFTLYFAYILYSAWRDMVSGKLDYYVKYMVLLVSGFLILSKVSNNSYFLWLSPSLIVFISRIRNHDLQLAKRLSMFYLFAAFTVTFLFGIVAILVQIVAGYPVFMFEDWNWVPMDKFLVEGLGYAPFDYLYLLTLFLRSIQPFMETCRSIAVVHHYLLIALCLIYNSSLAYFIYVAKKFPFENSK